MSKISNKQILDLALDESKKNDELVVEARLSGDWSKVIARRGIFWGRDKEVGSSYHAYCEFCGDLFEDCAIYKKENEKCARKIGWIIGNTKETKYIAVCPKCKAKQYKKSSNSLRKIMGKNISKKQFDEMLKASSNFYNKKILFDAKVEEIYGEHYSDFDFDFIIDSIDHGMGGISYECFCELMNLIKDGNGSDVIKYSSIIKKYGY